MFDPCHDGRPDEWEIDYDHSYADGMKFLGGGRHPRSNLYHDSSLWQNSGKLIGYTGAGNTAGVMWQWDNYLQRWVLGFNGTADYVNILAPTMRPFAADGTYSVWVSPTASTQTRPLIGQGSTAKVNWFYVIVNANNTVHFSFDDNTTRLEWDTTLTVPDAQWSHVAVVKNIAGFTSYINGVASGTGAARGDCSCAEAITIGYDQYAGIVHYWLGGMADPSIWNRALSASEISSLADPSNAMLNGLLLTPRCRLFAVGSSLNHYTMSVACGNYTLTGEAAGLLAQRKITPTAGSYTLTGESVSLLAARKFTAAAGTYTLTGEAIGLLAARKIVPTAGSYSLAGQSAGLRLSRIVAVACGSYALTGQAVGLKVSRRIQPTTGTYTLTGEPVTPIYSGPAVSAAASTYYYRLMMA